MSYRNFNNIPLTISMVTSMSYKEVSPHKNDIPN